MNLPYKIILASASPRRKALLEMMGLEFSVCVSQADESADIKEPDELVKALAYKKAHSVFIEYPHTCVIGADTIVYFQGRIIGKPKDKGEAYSTLKLLSGKTHEVYTGMAVLSPSLEQIICDKASVTFAELSDEDIYDYIATGDPLDKAGAYGMQGRGSHIVRYINGNSFTVVGLNTNLLFQALKACSESTAD